MRIGRNFLLDAIRSTKLGVDQAERGHAWLKRHNFKSAMPLFFRKEIFAVRDEQPEVARASHVHAWEIDFVENSMAQREPDAAVAIEGRSDPGFGTGSPARGDTCPS